jgi:hypothetical protein
LRKAGAKVGHGREKAKPARNFCGKMAQKPYYWTFLEPDLPGFQNLEGLVARKTKISSSVPENTSARSTLLK